MANTRTTLTRDGITLTLEEMRGQIVSTNSTPHPYANRIPPQQFQPELASVPCEFDERRPRIQPTSGATLAALSFPPAIQEGSRTALYDQVKPFGEALAATVGIATLSLPFLMRSLAMKGDPTIFVQRRVGLGGEIFDVIKLRTFTTVKENPDALAPSADLVPVRGGPFLRNSHLDEGLQFLQVAGLHTAFLRLRTLCRTIAGYETISFKPVEGQEFIQRDRPYLVTRVASFIWKHLRLERPNMALIGPRPVVPKKAALLERANPDDYIVRLSVRPGITGLAQIDLRNPIDEQDLKREAALDAWYVRNRSLALDLVIGALTVPYCLIGGKKPFGRHIARLWPGGTKLSDEFTVQSKQSKD